LCAARRDRGGSPSAPTRLAMCANSSTICATSTLRRTSPRTLRPKLGDRHSYDPPAELYDQSAKAQTNRGAVRLGPDHRRPRAYVARRRAVAVQVHSDNGRLRPRPATHDIGQTRRHYGPHGNEIGTSCQRIFQRPARRGWRTLTAEVDWLWSARPRRPARRGSQIEGPGRH
jgi:hypothetical protein